MICRFDDDDQRTAELPLPRLNQLSTIDDHSGALWIRKGAAWVEPRAYSQSGNTVVTTGPGGGGVIILGAGTDIAGESYAGAGYQPFAGGGNVIHMTDGDASLAVFHTFGVISGQNLADRFGFIARNPDGTAVISGGVRVHWTVIGLRGPD